MENCVKIREVTARYNITARTLRYYEDMGLIESVRERDCAYRMYGADAVKRLEQILILRKLNISIKDIARIFASKDAGVVLEVLSQKAADIDDEVALLHELKGLILAFMEQIREMDFQKEADVKRLYEKAGEIEMQLTHGAYEGNPATVNRMMAVAGRLEKLPDVRVVELPPCRMVSSGVETGEMFAPDSRLARFDKWFSEADKKRRDRFFPRDFMWFDEENRGTVWWYALPEDAEAPEGFELADFEGGLYAAAVSKDGDTDDGLRVYNGIKTWIDHGGYFSLDERPGHYHMCHIIGTPEIGRAMGYSQLEIYVPIKPRPAAAVDKMHIRRRINDAATLHFDLLGDGAHMEKQAFERYKIIHPKPGESGPASLYDIRLDNLTQAQAEELIGEIKAKGMHVWWDICFPPAIKELIFGNRPLPGPEPNGEESYMAMPAHEKPAYDAPDTAITVRRVTGAEAFSQWAELTNKLFGEGLLMHPVHHYHLVQKGALSCYIGYLHGTPAGVCCMMKREDLAGLNLVATNPAFRGRGLASAVCQRAVEEAILDGAALITGCAWPQAKGLARRLGLAYF